MTPSASTIVLRCRRHQPLLPCDRLSEPAPARLHYLLEAGWKADSAIQGLGRSNQGPTMQAQPPLFGP
ncbi:MAG: strawberry notch C-terminal domain-containing protein [Hyphomicrobiales bacterium]